MNERFNAAGENGRDCPICYRLGALKAELYDATQFHCLGCATVFLLVAPGTLERVPTPPVRRLTLEELDRARGGAGTYREPVDMVCRECGAKHCHGHPQERAGR